MNTYSLKKDTYLDLCDQFDYDAIKQLAFNTKSVDTYGITCNLEKITSKIKQLTLNYDTINKSFEEYGLTDAKVKYKKYIPSLVLFRFFRVLDLLLSDNSPYIENCVKKACEEYDFLKQKSDANTKGDWEICFSTHPWDILTMSMRGIGSCMTWTSHNSQTLLGSVVDPNCGLIYLTDNSYNSLDVDGITLYHKDPSSKINSNKNNTHMLYRSVVRLITLPDNKKALFLERIYSSYKQIKSGALLQDMVLSAFISFLKSKTKLEIFTKLPNGATITTSPVVQALSNTQFLSYRDSGIKYN